MAETMDKLKQMEQEMDRFEAEIAHQDNTSESFTTISGGFTFPATTAFLPPQLRLHHTNPVGVQPSYPVLPMPPGVSLYMPMSQPTLPCFPLTMPPAPLPATQVYAPPKVSANQQASAKPEGIQHKERSEVVQLTQKVITAPPQMAGPTELAARAREAAVAAAAAKSKIADDDDDVTRALLAAAAGVTYTRIQGPNGKEKVIASITKPPLTPITSQTTTKAKTDDLTANKLIPTMLPPPTLPPPAYRSVATSATATQNQTGKKKRYIRAAAGVTWEDPTLADWDPNDFRIFCGDLGLEVNDDTLAKEFRRYPSFQKARVVRDKRTNKSRGYGFVSFSDPNDFTRAMREMNGKYVGNRPIKLKRSDWRNRQLEVIRKREKEKKKLGLKN